MRDLRKQRYKALLKDGFLEHESRYYSQFPISTPGMRTVRRYRAKEIKIAKQYDIIGEKFTDLIMDSYKAHNLIDKTGRPMADKWNAKFIDQLDKPRKQRDLMIIPPERYMLYLKMKRSKLSTKDSLKMATNIPASMWAERKQQYDLLRRSHYTSWEAMKIITAKNKDGSLQKLNLTGDVWKEALKARIEYYSNMMAVGRKKGLTPQQAMLRVFKEINDYYKRDSKNTPFSFLREFYKKAQKKDVDFIESMGRRRDKISKRMPWGKK
jgi:hypothetical protein